MNILIPHAWLMQHLTTKATPKQIEKYLSLCGPTVESVAKIKGDYVYDIEITTNRVDSMSVRGIAREAATILPQFNIKAKLKPLSQPKISSAKKLDFTIKNNPRLCKRILAIKLTNVNIKPSPQQIQNRLTQVGQRPLNNAIDITNFVMWELGHPIHVFDYDRLIKKTIIVREAKSGEKLTSLDDITHSLKGGEVIFDDGTGNIIDLPGIMGTKNSVVTNSTKNILLWIEAIDPVKIRFASMAHAIRSQAAVLNEKHVDPELGKSAILRTAQLMQKHADATIDSKLVDIYPHKPIAKPVILKQNQLDTYLGLQITPTRVKRILENLGCRVTIISPQKQKVARSSHLEGGHLRPPSFSYHVRPPSWRSNDLKIPQDIIEEIARIYGYHNLPSKIMDTPIPDNPVAENFDLEYQIKTWLVGWGLTETYTYSMVSKQVASDSGNKLSDHLKLKNPLSDEWVYMRTSLIPSLIQATAENQREKITLFEMQNVYLQGKKGQLPNEQLRLTVVSTQSYRHLKGILDLLTDKLHLPQVSITPTKSHPQTFSVGKVAEIKTGKTLLGYIGKTSNHDLVALDLLIEPLSKNSSTHPRYIPIINTPPIIEDLTFTLKPKTHLGEIIDEIINTSKFVETVDLKEIYQNNYTFTLTYRDPNKSLTDKRIAPIRKKIVANLKKSFSAKLKGSLK